MFIRPILLNKGSSRETYIFVVEETVMFTVDKWRDCFHVWKTMMKSPRTRTRLTDVPLEKEDATEKAYDWAVLEALEYARRAKN